MAGGQGKDDEDKPGQWKETDLTDGREAESTDGYYSKDRLDQCFPLMEMWARICDTDAITNNHGRCLTWG